MINFKIKNINDFNELEKSFSESRSELRSAAISMMDPILIESMKILTMHASCNEDLKHWFDELSGFLINIVNCGFSPSIGYLPFELNSYPKGFKKEEIQTLFMDSSRSHESLINYLLRKIYTVKVNHRNKYRDILEIEKSNGNIYNPETYCYQLKYIALCLTGQLTPEVNNWYDQEVYTSNVDWTRSFMPISNITKEILRKKLLKIFENIIGPSKGLK